MRKLILPLLAICCVLSSCSPFYYLSNNSNIPLLKEKEEAQVSGFVGSAADFGFMGLNSAYALTRNTGLMFNASVFVGEEILPEENVSPSAADNKNYNPANRSLMGELGYGYFLPFGSDSTFVFETYVGYGLYSNNRAFDETRSISYLIHRPFIQPSIGFRHKNFEAAFGIRFVKMSYFNRSPSDAFAIDEVAMSDFGLWHGAINIEPNFTVRVGGPTVKFQMQWVRSNENLVFGSSPTLFYSSGNANFGIQLRF